MDPLLVVAVAARSLLFNRLVGEPELVSDVDGPEHSAQEEAVHALGGFFRVVVDAVGLERSLGHLVVFFLSELDHVDRDLPALASEDQVDQLLGVRSQSLRELDVQYARHAVASTLLVRSSVK